MSLFDETTIEAASPEGQEVTETVETEEQPEQEEVESEEPGEEQETEEGTPSDEESEQGEEIPEKFQGSVANLIKGYKELERKFHESRQQKPPAQPQRTDYGEEESPNDIVQRAFAQDPIGTIQYFVNQALAPVQEQQATETLTKNMESITKQYGKQLASEDGMKAYFEKIGELATELGNPGLVRNPPARVLRMAAEELWGTESKQFVYNKAKAAGRQEAEATRQAKQGLNAPKGAKKQEQPVSAEDAIRQGILAAGRGGGGLLD